MSTGAEAHAPPPPTEIAVHPDNADLIAVRGEGDGVVFSEDGGESWRLVCAAVPETDDGEAVEMEHISGGRILFSSFRGVQQVGSDGCGWSIPASTLDGPTIGDLRRHPGMASTFFAATKQGGQMNGVYRSDDESASWAPLGPQLSGFFSYLRVAPSNPDRPDQAQRRRR